MDNKIIQCKVPDRRLPGDIGYTLMEVLIAIAIFSIGMLAIASMQLGATQGTSTARFNTELTAFAEDQMERLTRLPFDHDDLVETGPIGGTGVVPHTFASNDNRFNAEWWVEDNIVFLGTKTVTLTTTENNRTFTMQHIIPEIARRDD